MNKNNNYIVYLHNFKLLQKVKKKTKPKQDAYCQNL